MLKRFIPRLLLALLVLTGSGLSRNSAGLRAQIGGIGFGAHGFIGMPDTAYAGDSTLVLAYVKNYDTLNFFNDTIRIQGTIDTGSGPVQFSFPPISHFTLLHGDSQIVLANVPFHTNSMLGQKLRIGSNVIVVWPVVDNPYFGIHDSLSVTVFVMDTISGLGPEHFAPDEGVRCYPVPASGPMYITSTNPQLHPKEITVRDAGGKTVFVSETPMLGIETESWANGVYFLEVVFDNGSRRVYKVVK